MTKDDVSVAVENIRRFSEMKKRLVSLPVLKLDTYKRAKETEEMLRDRLERMKEKGKK